jgi:hypothetical protein
MAGVVSPVTLARNVAEVLCATVATPSIVIPPPDGPARVIAWLLAAPFRM